MRNENHGNDAISKIRSFLANLFCLGAPGGFKPIDVPGVLRGVRAVEAVWVLRAVRKLRALRILRAVGAVWVLRVLLVLPALFFHISGCNEYHVRRQLDKGRYKSALERLQRSNKKNPYLRAQALKGLKRYEEAYQASLEEVKRYQNRSRGPVKPFILAAELAHRLDYAQECLELLEMASKRGTLKPPYKVIEALRRLDRAEHLLAMGAVVSPTNDITRAIQLIHDMGIKVPPASGSGSSSGSVPSTNNSNMSKERLETLAYRAWTASAVWAFAMNKKSEAIKWLSKPSTSAEEKLIKGECPEALIPARRGLETLIKDHTVSLTTITDITDIITTVGLMEKLGAHEAVVKAVNLKVAVAHRGATKLDPSTSHSLFTLLEKGLRSAQKTWDRRASWKLQEKLATFAEHPETSSALTARFVKTLTTECLFWEDSFSPACRSLERVAVKRADPLLLAHWVDTLKQMNGPGYALGHTAGIKALLERTRPSTQHDVLALRLKEGPAAMFRELEEDALTWITQPMPMVEFEKRITQKISEFSGYETPLALVWLHRLVNHLKENSKATSTAKPRPTSKARPSATTKAPEKTTTQEDGNLSAAQRISTEEALLRINLLKELSKPLKRSLGEWINLLYLILINSESIKQSALVSRWLAHLPTKQHQKLLMNLLGSVVSSHKPASHKSTSHKPTSHKPTSSIRENTRGVLIASAAVTSLKLAYYKTYNSQKAEQRDKQNNTAPEKPGDLKKARKREVEPIEKQAEKPVEKLSGLVKEEIKSFVCSLASDSPTVWQARLLVLLGNPQKARDTLLRALRTGPKGFGLCRTSSVLLHLQKLGLSAEKPAHHIASSFKEDPHLLRPAALALAESPNSGWADLAGEDLIAASPDGGRELLKLSRAHLNANRCGHAGRLGIKVFQWVNPTLPAHAPALKLTAQIFARCHRTDRLLARLEYWRKNQGHTKPLHKHQKETAVEIPKEHSFNRALRLVINELSETGLKKETRKISRHFGAHSPNIKNSGRAEGSRRHDEKNSSHKGTDALHHAERVFKLNPLSPRTACRLAEQLIKERAHDLAASLLKRAFLLKPSAYCAHRLMAKLAIEQKNFEGAEEWLAWMIINKGRWPNTPSTQKETDPRGELAELYLMLSKPHAAVCLYEKALSCPTQSIQQRKATLKSLWSIINDMLHDKLH